MRPVPGITMKKGNRFNAQCGFSLLEALVTIVVVSIGLLGILGLQTASVVNTRISSFRSNATVLADNFAERMRANPSGDYDAIAVVEKNDDTINFNIGDSDITKNPAACGNSGTCTFDNNADIAEYAVWEWGQTLARKLPKGRGYVDCVDCTTPNNKIYRITIAWTEQDSTRSAQGNGDSDTTTNNDHGCGAADENIIRRCFVTRVRL